MLATRPAKKVVGIGRFASRLPDLGSNKKHLQGIRPAKPVLLDTGVIVALLDRSERHHVRCVRVIEELERPLVTCEAVIAESCYLLRRLPGSGRRCFGERGPLVSFNLGTLSVLCSVLSIVALRRAGNCGAPSVTEFEG